MSVAISNKASEIFFPTANYNNDTNLLIVLLNSTTAATGCTYNGVAMTQLGSNTTARGRTQNVWFLKNPATGSNSVVASGGSDYYGKAISVSGADLTNTFEGTTTATGTSATPSITVTTTSNNCLVFGAGTQGDSPTAGASTTSETGGTQPFQNFWRSTNPVSPAGAFTINVNCTSDTFGFIGFGIKPFGKTFDVTETITLTETSTNLRDRNFSIAETTTLIEAWTTLRGISFSIAETIGLVEAYNFVHNKVFSIAETISLIESPFTLLKKWNNTPKNNSTMSNTPKNNSTWTNEPKN